MDMYYMLFDRKSQCLMTLNDCFTLTLDVHEVVALEWFFDTYLKKIQDGAWKDTMQKLSDRFKDEIRYSERLKLQQNEEKDY